MIPEEQKMDEKTKALLDRRRVDGKPRKSHWACSA
jgi:hypothetical protein